MKNLGISPEDPLGVTVTRLRVESVKQGSAFLNYLNASYVCVLRRGFALFVCLYCVLCVCVDKYCVCIVFVWLYVSCVVFVLVWLCLACVCAAK